MYKLHNYKSMVVHTFHQRTSLHFICNVSLPSTFRRFITTLQNPSLHFISLISTFLTLFLKTCDLKGKVPSASVGSWFQNLIALSTQEYFPMSVLSCLALIFRSWSSLLGCHGLCTPSAADFHTLWRGCMCELSFQKQKILNKVSQECHLSILSEVKKSFRSQLKLSRSFYRFSMGLVDCPATSVTN